ncbi:hypothetical protein CORC01_12203 [Colletotrichum orchidophilum]|uniref:Phytochrome chromophore attachment site domain-containing protein n=1 Tax=Colletotrichum orchidophilum TaxID=1209926 RepID=A0A1G4ATQ5_9PEZI|nr:uncharacterized protein CORC01_12203 [Colletotrichum orchidophilum]OHE92485.1 hypothetical protein CORC01_12203 [Colletotrichum orchidophilum]
MAQPPHPNEDDVQFLYQNPENPENPIESASNNVQSFGFLIAFTESDARRLVVKCASDNSASFTGYSPNDLFELEDFGSILGSGDLDTLMTRLSYLKESRIDGVAGGRAVFNLSIFSKQGEPERFWCSMHLRSCPPDPDTVVCEFEVFNDASPSISGHRSHTSDVAKKIPRTSRRVGNEGGELNTAQAIGIMSKIQGTFAATGSLAAVPDTIVTTVKELTEFDRVILYRVDEFMAVTVLDSRDREWRGSHRCIHLTTLPSGRNGIHPSPFPSQLRLVHDREAQPVSVVYKNGDSHQKQPGDLDRSYLSTASPTFFEEIEAEDNSARSSMAIPINAFGKRWGLVVCHAYRPEGTRISISKRQMCEFIGSTSGCAIERLSYASMLGNVESSQTRRESIRHPAESTAASRDLLRLFDAEFALMSTRGEVGRLGEPSEESFREAMAIVRCIQPCKTKSVIVSSDVLAELPDVGIPGARTISGLLWAPLSTYGGDFVVFFRQKQTESSAPREDVSSSTSNKSRAASDPSHEWSDKQVRMAMALGSLGRQLPHPQDSKEGGSLTLQSALSLAKLEPYVYRNVGSIVECLNVVFLASATKGRARATGLYSGGFYSGGICSGGIHSDFATLDDIPDRSRGIQWWTPHPIGNGPHWQPYENGKMPSNSQSEDAAERPLLADPHHEYGGTDGPAPPVLIAEERGAGTFSRNLGAVEAFAIVISIVIGSGVFTSPGSIDTNVPSPGAALVVWLVGGVLAWTGASTMAELGTAIPGEGGVQPFLQHIYGDVFGFLAAWTWIVAVMPATLAILSIVFVESIYSAGGVTDQAGALSHKLYSILILVVMNGANSISTKASTRLNNLFVVTKFTSIFAVVLAGIVVVILQVTDHDRDVGGRDWFNKPWFGNRKTSLPGRGELDWNKVGTWDMLGYYSAALYGALWAYSGWDKAVYVSAELQQPARQLPLAINTAVPTIILCFIAANAAYYVLLPWDVVSATDSVAVTAINRLLGPVFGIVAAVLICLVVAGSLLGNSFVAGRMTVAASNFNWLPKFLGFVGRVGFKSGESSPADASTDEASRPAKARSDAPLNALLLSTILSALYILLGNFRALLTFNGLGEYTFFFLTVLGAVILRVREPKLRRPYKPFVLIPIVFALVSGFVVVRGAIFAPVQALILLVLWLVGLGFYWARRKYYAHCNRADH